MGKLDTVTVNGPEGDVIDWDAVHWRAVEDDVRRLRQRIFTATQAGDLKKVVSSTVTADAACQTAPTVSQHLLHTRPGRLQGLLEPGASKRRTPFLGGGGAAMRRRYPTTGRSTCWKPAERGCIRRIHWESKGSAIAG